MKKLKPAADWPDFEKMTPAEEERWWETHDISLLMKNASSERARLSFVRDEVVRVRVSKPELNKISRRSRQTGAPSISEYVRRVILTDVSKAAWKNCNSSPSNSTGLGSGTSTRTANDFGVLDGSTTATNGNQDADALTVAVGVSF